MLDTFRDALLRAAPHLRCNRPNLVFHLPDSETADQLYSWSRKIERRSDRIGKIQGIGPASQFIAGLKDLTTNPLDRSAMARSAAQGPMAAHGVAN